MYSIVASINTDRANKHFTVSFKEANNFSEAYGNSNVFEFVDFLGGLLQIIKGRNAFDSSWDSSNPSLSSVYDNLHRYDNGSKMTFTYMDSNGKSESVEFCISGPKLSITCKGIDNSCEEFVIDDDCNINICGVGMKFSAYLAIKYKKIFFFMKNIAIFDAINLISYSTSKEVEKSFRNMIDDEDDILNFHTISEFADSLTGFVLYALHKEAFVLLVDGYSKKYNTAKSFEPSNNDEEDLLKKFRGMYPNSFPIHVIYSDMIPEIFEFGSFKKFMEEATNSKIPDTDMVVRGLYENIMREILSDDNVADDEDDQPTVFRI